MLHLCNMYYVPYINTIFEWIFNGIGTIIFIILFESQITGVKDYSGGTVLQKVYYNSLQIYFAIIYSSYCIRIAVLSKYHLIYFKKYLLILVMFYH